LRVWRCQTWTTDCGRNHGTWSNPLPNNALRSASGALSQGLKFPCPSPPRQTPRRNLPNAIHPPDALTSPRRGLAPAGRSSPTPQTTPGRRLGRWTRRFQAFNSCRGCAVLGLKSPNRETMSQFMSRYPLGSDARRPTGKSAPPKPARSRVWRHGLRYAEDELVEFERTRGRCYQRDQGAQTTETQGGHGCCRTWDFPASPHRHRA
jgi:hypothetical protein